ncbi:MAG TPA: hypothetical protein ACFYD3_00620 [Candidatus Hypogeohydataceae bacterium YC41]
MVLAILGVLAGAITPVALHVTRQKKELATSEELQTLKKAIIGNTQSIQFGAEPTFGYIKDIGSLPQNLQDLYIQPTGIPSFSFNSTLGIGSGWRGPYVAKKAYASVTDFIQDPYGRPYAYSTASAINTTLGVEVRGTIKSLGSDGIDDTQDDLTIEIFKPEILADVAGKVRDVSGIGVSTVYVTIYYPRDGTLTSSTTQTDLEGRYQFSNIPIGERAITLQPGLVFIPGTAFAKGTTQTEVGFSVANLSTNAITVSSITTYYDTMPPAYYRRVRINGSILRDALPGIGTGEVASFAPLVVVPSTLQREAFHFLLRSASMEIPDMELNTIGAGGVMTVELEDFTTVRTGGSPVDMAGVPFTVIFSNGSTVSFTPQRQ